MSITTRLFFGLADPQDATPGGTNLKKEFLEPTPDICAANKTFPCDSLRSSPGNNLDRPYPPENWIRETTENICSRRRDRRSVKLNIHHDIRAKLNTYLVSKNIPHILFYGESGSGKKTLVLDFIHCIYSGDAARIRENTFFSNCSHSKGIRHIRENLKEYSRGNVAADGSVPFKSVVLYNFENLSVDGQSALRRVIELYSRNTRFFLVSNSKERILNPILSRFAHIFVPFPCLGSGAAARSDCQSTEESGTPINLHQWNLREYQWAHDRATETAKHNLLEKVNDLFDRFWSLQSAPAATATATADQKKIYPELFSFAADCETMAISALDLMDIFRVHPRLDESTRAELDIFFLKVRGEMVHEGLFIVFLWSFLFFRSQCNLKNVSFM